MNRIIAALFSATVLTSCPQPRVPAEDYDITVTPPFEDADAAAKKVPNECRIACENLAKIACPESAPAGLPCGNVCAAATLNGFDMKLSCVASASSGDQVRACCPLGSSGCTPTLCKGR